MLVIAVTGGVYIITEWQGPGMGGRQVIHLVEGIHTGFPVAIDLNGDEGVCLPVFESIGPQVFRDNTQVKAE